MSSISEVEFSDLNSQKFGQSSAKTQAIPDFPISESNLEAIALADIVVRIRNLSKSNC